jgi:hypothetical protein
MSACAARLPRVLLTLLLVGLLLLLLQAAVMLLLLLAMVVVVVLLVPLPCKVPAACWPWRCSIVSYVFMTNNKQTAWQT